MKDYTIDANVQNLTKHIDPFSAWNELDSPITKEEVMDVVKNGQAEKVKTPLHLSVGKNVDKTLARKNHIKKIAWFVLNKPELAIQIEVDQYSMIELNDGNHRLCGSIIREDETIKTEFSGFVDSIDLLDFI